MPLKPTRFAQWLPGVLWFFNSLVVVWPFVLFNRGRLKSVLAFERGIVKPTKNILLKDVLKQYALNLTGGLKCIGKKFRGY